MSSTVGRECTRAISVYTAVVERIKTDLLSLERPSRDNLAQDQAKKCLVISTDITDTADNINKGKHAAYIRQLRKSLMRNTRLKNFWESVLCADISAATKHNEDCKKDSIAEMEEIAESSLQICANEHTYKTDGSIVIKTVHGEEVYRRFCENEKREFEKRDYVLEYTRRFVASKPKKQPSVRHTTTTPQNAGKKRPKAVRSLNF